MKCAMRESIIPIPLRWRFMINAIGNSDTLVSALEMPGGVLSQLKPLNIKVTLQKVNSVDLPAVTEPLKFKYAVVSMETKGG